MPASTWTEPPRDWTAGELVTEAIMDTHVKNQLISTLHLLKYKSSDETVTSSTVLQNDDDLVYAVGANELWYFDFSLYTDDSGSGTGEMKIAFTWPASAVSGLTGVVVLSGGAVTIQNFITSGTSAGIVPSVDGKTFHVTGSLATAGTAGSLNSSSLRPPRTRTAAP